MDLIILIFLPIIGALISLLFIKHKKIVLTLFLGISAYLSYILYFLYGKWDTFIEYDLGMKLFNENVVLGFKVNPLGWYFAFFSMLITILIAIFSLGYKDKYNQGIIPIWFVLIMANMGIFFAKDFLTFFIMWEAMGITSYFIIAQGKKIAEKAARFYISLSLIGTSTLIFGILLLASLTSTFNIETSVMALIANASTDNMAKIILVLFAITFLIKSAVFPFYMWPSRAYAEAPDEFTPFLSTIMSKYGIYGFILFIMPVLKYAPFQAIGKINAPAYILAILGAITAVIGTILAIFQTDMKKLFAYSSVSNIGYIMMGLSTMSLTGVQGALFHSVNHMVFKTAIFLSLAATIYRTGERDMHKVGGLVYRMPITFMTYLLAIIAAAGIPPLNGFPSKWLIIQSLMSSRMPFIAIAMIFASAGSFMYLFRILASVFLGQLPDKYKNIKEAPPLMLIPMVILMGAMMLIGVLPGLVLRVINPALSYLGFETGEISLSTMKSALSNSDLNVTYIFYIFVAGVVVAGLLYIFSAKQETIPQEDNYTAGEDPKDWGTTPDRFNFSYGFYQPFKEIFIPILNKVSFTRWMGYFGDNLVRVSKSLRKFYRRIDASLIMLTLGILIMVIGGILI
ncbi:MAG: proton-conducting transporter membrane subunit [Clostridiaceae bacterium]